MIQYFRKFPSIEYDISGSKERTLVSNILHRVKIRDVINQNMMDHYKKLNSGIRTIEEDMTEIKQTLEVLRDAVRDVVKELRLLARKDDLKVLEKYINLWSPVNIVTKEEVEEMLEKRLKNVRSKK